MGFLARLRGSTDDVEKRHLSTETMLWPDDWQGWLPSAFPGFTTGLANQVAVVWRCVDLISSAVAAMALQVFRDSETIPGPLWLTNPNPDFYGHIGDAVTELLQSLLYHGNAYPFVTLRHADGYPAEWVVLDPSTISIEWTRTDAAADGPYRYMREGVVLPRADVVHIKMSSRPGDPYGHSPLEGAAAAVSSAWHSQKYATEVAQAGGIPPAVLKTAGELTGDEAKALQKAWVDATRTRNGAPAVLAGSLEFEPLGRSATDDALDAMRTADALRIASAFGVPAFMLNLPTSDSLTYSTVAMQQQAFYQQAVLAHTTNIERALSYAMFPRGTYVRFNEDILLRADLRARMAAYETAIGAGIYTVDEVRAIENLPPRVGFDDTELADLMAVATGDRS